LGRSTAGGADTKRPDTSQSRPMPSAAVNSGWSQRIATSINRFQIRGHSISETAR